VVALLAVTGCASDTGGGSAADVPDRPQISMTPGMTMGAPGGDGAQPSETASMICDEEIHHAVQETFGLSSLASGRSTWAAGLYTCTYRSGGGKLVLSVQDATDLAAGRRYFDAVRAKLAPLKALRGLEAFGLPSYESAAGQVLFLKDGKTLLVDATGLPAVSGPHHLSPADVAYAIAADVIGCWSE
jgi:hypothetical protein